MKLYNLITLLLFVPAIALAGPTPPPGVQQSGTPTSGDCAKYASASASGLITDSGGPCGGSITYPITVPGSAATDSAAVGSELTSSSGWTSTGWTGSYNSFTHTSGNTNALSYSIAGMASGQFYLVSITVSGTTAGNMTASLGSTPLTFGGGNDGTISSNATYATGPKTTGTGAFTITPSSTFNGTVSVSVKLLSPITTYNLVFNDNGGTSVLAFAQQLHNAGNLFIGTPSNDMGGRYNVPVLSGFTSGPPGTANTGLGINTLGFNTTGANNTAVGQVALSNNTTGQENTAIGVDSMVYNVSGGSNTAVGAQSLGGNTSGYGNVAIGVEALYLSATGTGNTAVGTAALAATTTGSSLTAVGNGALGADTGSYNSAFGNNALAVETTGTYDSAFGYLAMQNASGSTYNAAFGAQALQSATSSYNVAIGAGAALKTTSGANNVAIGYNSLYSNQLSYYNTAVGYEALFNSTGGSNTAIGNKAGFNSTTGLDNIYIGYQTEPAATGDLYEIVMGYNLTGDGSYTTRIGTVGQTQLTDLVGNIIRVAPTTVSGLATVDASPADGDRGYVTDATACTFGVAVVGSGSVHCPVHYDSSSTNWKAG